MNKKIILLVIISYLVRLFISLFFVQFPVIPHDFYAHAGAGEAMINGNFLMETSQTFQAKPLPHLYGPFFVCLVTVWYLLWGVFDFFMYKIPVIIFDVMNIVMVYFIGRKILKEQQAFYVSLLYCFSFIALYNSSVIGHNTIYSLFFLLTSVYFLMDKKLLYSAIFFAVVIMFRFAPWVLFLPVMCFYVLREWGTRSVTKYLLVFSLSFFLMLLPFISLAGWFKATYFILGSHTGFQQSEQPYSLLMSFYNIFLLMTNVNINRLVLPIMGIVYAITLCSIFIKRVKNKEVELLRNIVLLGIVGLLFGPGLVGSYMGWIIAPLFILFGTKLIGWHITKQWIFGAILIILSLIVFSTIDRENFVQYSKLDRMLLFSSVIIAPIGVFNFLHFLGNKHRLIWTLIVLAIIMSIELEAAPLLIFPIKDISKNLIDLSHFTLINKMYGDHIQGRSEVFLAYGSFYLGSAVILWFCLGFLYYNLLKDKFQNYDEEKYIYYKSEKRNLTALKK